MDDWKPEDPTLLEFDLNECTTRDFCEVFSMPTRDARGLYEYRVESMHIFKFDQLLKLKGVEEEMIEQWTKPQADPDFDKELQKTLGLQAETPEALSTLLETICQKSGASGCLMASRDSRVLLQTLKEGLALDQIARELPEFVRPIQEDMIQMKVGIAGVQVIGFDSCDLVFVPASGFYIGAMHPPRSLSASSLGLWRSFAAEIRRRLPPKILINNHTKVLDDDIAFDCPSCVLRIVVDRAAAGYDFQCPRCKAQVTVPDQTTSFSSFRDPSAGAAPAAS